MFDPQAASVIKPGGPGCHDIAVSMELELAVAASYSGARRLGLLNPQTQMSIID